MDEQRAEFEAAFPIPDGMVVWSGDKVACREGFENSYRVDRYVGQWAAWQAATQRQQERIAELEAQVQALSLDAARYQFLRAGGAYLEPNSEEIYMATDDGGKYYHDRRDLDMDIDAAIARATHKEGG